MQVPPLFCDEFEFELFPREFELLLEAIWFPVLFALGPPDVGDGEPDPPEAVPGGCCWCCCKEAKELPTRAE